ncbi:SRPBCC family protein [Patulibacter minatonensis]|uniref:SRPBCC family protein n=1 Tax=Patulibacter minatonensis TaxID=298163 RepID=UPI00047D1ACA|nr:SRPBCC family protein [Patulibacter minatonensis]
MPTASFSVQIARPRSEVFAFLADLRNATSWMSIVDTVELVGGTPGEVGARFLVTNERGILDDIVVDYATAEVEADASLRFEVKHPKLTGADTYRLSDRDGGTFVEYDSDFTYTGLNKLSTPIGALAVKALARGMDEDLRERLENG